MGLNYRKSINLGKGLKINISKGGPSISFGPKGLRFSLNTRGQARGNLSIPGTGVSYNKRVNIFNFIKRLFVSDENVKKAELEEKLQDNEISEDTKAEVKNKLVENYFERMSNVHKEVDEAVNWKEVFESQDENTEEGRNIKELAEKVLKGDDDSYLTVIKEMNPFEDLIDFGSQFEVGTLGDEIMGVSFNINEDESIPRTETTYLKSGEAREKELSESKRNNLIKSYVSSTIIRIARDLFSLLPVNEIVVNAEDNRINKATGNSEEITLVSVIFDRENFSKINFENIDPFETLKSFKSNIDFKQNKGGFQEVLPIK